MEDKMADQRVIPGQGTFSYGKKTGVQYTQNYGCNKNGYCNYRFDPDFFDNSYDFFIKQVNAGKETYNNKMCCNQAPLKPFQSN